VNRGRALILHSPVDRFEPQRIVADGPALTEAMGLRDDQRVLLAQTVGYPAE
jgi:hypothetical protein